jgi:phosphonate transport system permease protein
MTMSGPITEAHFRRPPLLGLRPLRSAAVSLAILIVFAWAWQGAEIRPYDLIRYSGNMVQLAQDFFPPDFSDWRTYMREMLVTIQIAIWGTGLAILFAVPCGILCAANIAPVWVYQPMRRLMDMLRSINELIFAMLFVVAVGLGPFAGVLALFVHTLGVLAKLFAEAVEAIDPHPVEGIRSTGAGKIEEIAYGVLPQVMPLWISFSLYRFESNIRSAAAIGMVGAGGIGQVMFEIIRGFQFAQTSALLIIVIISVSLVDLFSQWVRKTFV